MKRPNTFSFNLNLLKDLWTHIYGIMTVISFLAAITFTIFTLNKSTVEFKEVLYVCLGLISILSIVIIRISARYSNLHSMSADLLNYKRENENLITLLQLQSETTHNILHYYRSLTYDFDKIIEKIDKEQTVSQEEITYVCDRNHHFLIMLSSSLQNYFSIHTDDNCSISIKSICKNSKNVKTIFRDPVNLKKRRQAELKSGNPSYPIKENSAFDIIMSENFKDFYYAKDDLYEEYKSYNYKNRNINWNNYYNSLIVVPISKINHIENKRKVLGFLTVDNKQGYLVDNTTIEYMLAIGDLMYNYCLKIKKISIFTMENNLQNERQDDFFWD